MPLRVGVLWLLVGLVHGPLPEHLRAWSPLLELGDGERPLTTAVVKVASLTRLAEAMTHNLEIDAGTKALFEDVGEQLETLDPKSMYGLMAASKSEDTRHSMSVFGELSTKGDYRVVASRGARSPRFGNLEFTVAMKPASTDSYLLETNVSAQLEVTSQELGGVASGAMTFLSENAAEHGARAGGGLDEADRAVGREIASAFPAMSALAEKYFLPLDGVAKNQSGTRGRIVGRLRHDAFAKDYPELAELLTDDVKAKVRARLDTADGRPLALLKIDSPTGEGAFLFETDPKRWITENYRVEADIDAELWGLRIQVSKVEVRTRTEQNARSFVIRSTYDRQPKVAISGAALGVVPVALVDALIPSNLDAIVADFLGTLARTDHGKGASVIVTLPANKADPLRLTSRAELRNNGFVSFWLSIASSEIFENEDVLHEMQLLQERALAAFTSDFARFQDQAL